ncbi:unnamed protein product [Fraxinus pennsylvanica]|uniref:GATA transcription factor n=1 Tax=Fraxinus pennsylvanica TaxID=56036 RepID=A0AAD2DTW2_9LAMI|nr:unnamed protein product [Fraxinus pennsylvanica]
MNNFADDYAEFSSVENANVNNNISNVHFTVDELLDFSREDETMTDAFFDSLAGNASDSSIVVDSCNSSISGGGVGQFNGNISCGSVTDSQFSAAELYVPYDDLEELEWLSNFVEESFSSDDLHKLDFITTNTTKTTAVAAVTDNSSSSVTTTVTSTIHSPPPPIFPSDVGVPGKARSKRSRAAPCNWSSRLLLLAPPPAPSSNNNISISSNTKPLKTTSFKRRELTETPGRKCVHCASETTPQWRTGPMGPKTLCNACGVRYKSGRLVPEYRPASSPTFVSSRHSNSHRKVLELRRQKELMGQVHIFNASNGSHDQKADGCDDIMQMI